MLEDEQMRLAPSTHNKPKLSITARLRFMNALAQPPVGR